MSETEDRIKVLEASPWEAVQMIAERMRALWSDTSEGPGTRPLVDGPEVLAILAPMLEMLEHLLNILQQLRGTNEHAAAGMGARLVDRAMGPSSDEMTQVLSATEHALQRERARVGWLAHMALGLIELLPEAERATWRERYAARLQSLVDRDAPAEDPDAPAPGGDAIPFGGDGT